MASSRILRFFLTVRTRTVQVYYFVLRYCTRYLNYAYRDRYARYVNDLIFLFFLPKPLVSRECCTVIKRSVPKIEYGNSTFPYPAYFFMMSLSKKPRPHNSQSHLVQCPCCNKHVHRLLINDHLEQECRDPELSMPALNARNSNSLQEQDDDSAASARRDCYEMDENCTPLPFQTQERERVENSADNTAEGASVIVACPVCFMRLPADEVFFHLERECCETKPDVAASSSGVEAATGPSGLPCPACGRLLRSEVELNEHLDLDCSSSLPAPLSQPLTTPPSPPSAPDGVSNEADTPRTKLKTDEHLQVDAQSKVNPTNLGSGAFDAAKLRKLSVELKCPICMDLFEVHTSPQACCTTFDVTFIPSNTPQAPHSLPCQHSFCRDCIMEMFRVKSKMQCPLCNAPTWKRELRANHLLAGIVDAFKQVAPSDGLT